MSIIDFNEKKNEKETAYQTKLLRQFQLTKKQDFLHQLVQSKTLNIDAHRLLLAFIHSVEMNNEQVSEVFSAALHSTRFEFHHKFSYDWWTTIQCALTFLAIQKETNEYAFERYIQFIAKKL